MWPPAHGLLELREDGSFSYTPNDGFTGGDKFVYSATDALGEQSVATVVLNIATPAVVASPPVDDGSCSEVLAATTSLWQPATTSDQPFPAEVAGAIVAAFGAAVSTLSVMRYPLLLLAIALLVGLTVGRISILPFGVGKRREEGTVQSYDSTNGVGQVMPNEGDNEVFVQERSLEKLKTLEPGQRVRFIAADIRGRRIALRVWPVPS